MSGRCDQPYPSAFSAFRARERLPAGDDDVAVAGVELDAGADASGALAGDQVEPLPMKGSRTRAPGSLLLSMARSIKGSGFIVGCSGDSMGRSMRQTSSWSRPPFQTCFAPSRQPYQIGS